MHFPGLGPNTMSALVPDYFADGELDKDVRFLAEDEVTITTTRTRISDCDIGDLREFLSEEPTYLWSPGDFDEGILSHYLLLSSHDKLLVEIEVRYTPMPPNFMLPTGPPPCAFDPVS